MRKHRQFQAICRCRKTIAKATRARRVAHERVSYVDSVALRTSGAQTVQARRIAHTQARQPCEHVAPCTSKCVYYASTSRRAQVSAYTTRARRAAYKRRAYHARCRIAHKQTRRPRKYVTPRTSGTQLRKHVASHASKRVNHASTPHRATPTHPRGHQRSKR